MSADLQWLLLALPLSFAMGWLAARFDLKQLKRDQRDHPKAYFKGLSLLLNEQQDKAIDAFIEAVQHDPDTAELHFALGNLFRRRGEFERAVRVHEHLLARADLKPEERGRAQRALAQDFMRAGLFDRAEAAWNQLIGTRFDGEARLALLSLHERARDWSRAAETARQLQQQGAGDFAQRMSHYHCEQAVQADAAGDRARAEAELSLAHSAAPAAPRPLIMLGRSWVQQGQFRQALQTWQMLLSVAPAFFGLVASEYAKAAQALLDEQSAQTSTQGHDLLNEARATLAKAYAQTPSMPILRARLSLESNPAAARQALLDHAASQPTLSTAQNLLALASSGVHDSEALEAVRRAVDRAAGPLQRYRCAACGFEAQHWFWQCPGCLGWDSFPPQAIEEL